MQTAKSRKRAEHLRRDQVTNPTLLLSQTNESCQMDHDRSTSRDDKNDAGLSRDAVTDAIFEDVDERPCLDSVDPKMITYRSSLGVEQPASRPRPLPSTQQHTILDICQLLMSRTPSLSRQATSLDLDSPPDDARSNTFVIYENVKKLL